MTRLSALPVLTAGQAAPLRFSTATPTDSPHRIIGPVLAFHCMLIRFATNADHDAIWRILEPVIRAGETYALPRDMSEDAAVGYWTGADRESFIAELDGVVVGSYYLRANQLGGGGHVANCGYVTDRNATGRGVARRMCAHSLQQARMRGFRAMQFNLVVASNTRAVALWQSLGFETLARIPAAFAHPGLGYVDALVMHLAL